MATWSRKTYEMVASTIRQTREGYGHVGSMGICSASAYAGLRQLAKDFAVRFAADNPAFNGGRFLRACGLGGEEETL